MRTVLLTLLSACTVEAADPPRPTWQDAITAVAEAQCSKWIECGADTTEDWQTCVRNLVWDTCQLVLDMGTSCLAPYPRDFRLVRDCADWYASVDCRTYVPACGV